jgi:hypothetical protein
MWTRPRRAIEVAGLLVAVLAVAVVLAGHAAGARAEGVGGSWAATGSLPEGWLGGSAATLADGQVIAVGGGTYTEERGTTVMYSPTTGTWSQGPVLPGPGHHWTVVALAGGGALLLGETECSSSWPTICHPTTSTYLLSSKETEWLPAAPMHEARVEPIVVGLADGRVLVAGGFGDDCKEIAAEGFSCAAIDSAEAYDPVSGEWKVTAQMPQANGGGVGVLLSDGTVLVAGGSEERDAVRYEPTSGTWSAAGQTVSPRAGPLLFGLPGDRALALGSQPEAGFYGSLGGALERRELVCKPITSEIFTAAADAWVASPPPPAGGENCVSSKGALLAGGEILLGASDIKSEQESMYVLDPEQRCWSATGPVVQPRDGGDVVALADGRALLFGGREADGEPSSEQLSSAEIYTPGPDLCSPSDPPVADPGPEPEAGSGPTTTPPRFTGARIERRKRLAIAKGNVIHLLVRCPTGAVGRCVGHVRVALLAATSAGGRAKGHTESMFLGEASFAAVAGRTTTVTVRLTGHRRTLGALIRRWRQATVILTATARDGAGQFVTTTTSQTLR